MSIQILPTLLINQIAAGEVVERPASVVKELVENAIDAGATQIDIQLEDGGRELIRISDNGIGIPKSELQLAITQHATSKITSPDDLNAIATMGFRGEALASIASVSRLKIISRHKDADAGAMIEIEGASPSEVRPCSSSIGTTLEVRNLFFNTPARRKFMRGPNTELAHINQIMQKIAMAHNEVGFKITHHNRKQLDLPPNQSMTARCKAILGKDLADGLMGFEAEEQGLHLWGMAALPEFAKTSSRYQHTFINGRPIKDQTINHAIKEAYRGLIEPSRYPIAVIFITVDPDRVDVNVHPAKTEVRLMDSHRIHGLVLHAIRQRLLGSDLTPQVELPSTPSPQSNLPPISSPQKSAPLYPSSGTSNFASSSSGQTSFPSSPPSSGTRSGSGSYGPGLGSSSPSSPRAPRSASGNYVPCNTTPTSNFGSSKPASADQQAMHNFLQSNKQEVENNATYQPDLIAKPEANKRPTLQVDDRYLITQEDAGVLIIDKKHTVKNWLTNALIKQFKLGDLATQRLLQLLPAAPVLAQHQTELATIGFELSATGPGSYAFQSIPQLIFEHAAELSTITACLAENTTLLSKPEQQLALLADTCAASFSTTSDEKQLTQIFNYHFSLEADQQAAIHLSLHDLEKYFKRH